MNRTAFVTGMFPGGIYYLVPGQPVDVGGVKIYGHPFGQPFPQGCAPGSIVVSHAFYNCGRGDLLYASREEVSGSGAAWACFGHDHNQYPVEDAGGVRVVRPGALTRGTSHTENRVRRPSVALIDTATGTCEYVPVPFAKPFGEVFMVDHKVERERVDVTFADIQKFVDSFGDRQAGADPYGILRALGKPGDVERDAARYMEEAGLT
jgi:hypothetical protein